MEKVGFDRVEIDKMGNVLGFIGNGPRIIAFDADIRYRGRRQPFQLDL